MSTTRSLLLVALIALASSCGADDASLVINLDRVEHPGGAILYVCGPFAGKCKTVPVFDSGDGRKQADVGVYVKDDTQRLELQVQLSAPASCGHFTVDFAMDQEIDIALEYSNNEAFTVGSCGSCQREILPCDWDNRL
jgi:hypothetical protein